MRCGWARSSKRTSCSVHAKAKSDAAYWGRKKIMAQSSATTAGAPPGGDRIALLKVLGPAHVWALGVGIVLVGEFMGWNFSVGKGGAYGSLIACFVIGLL